MTGRSTRSRVPPGPSSLLVFVVRSPRKPLHTAMAGEEAARGATATAGGAGVFAGMTVVIALASLAIIGVPFLTAMGVAAAGPVAVAVVIAVTLMPALLGAVGH